jgi:hypothetical protein
MAVVRMDVDLFEMSGQRFEYLDVRKANRQVVD